MSRGARRCLRRRHLKATDLRLRQDPLQRRVKLHIKKGAPAHHSPHFNNPNLFSSLAGMLRDRIH